MDGISSRRELLAAGLALPASGLNPPPGTLSIGAAQPGSRPDISPRYKVLGRTGLKVATVSFGCMVTSDGSVLEMAADMGINYFDTARVYSGGNNERMVGAALKSRRRNLYLSSKTVASTKAAALDDLSTSLRELQTDYLDIWYLHDKRMPGQITEELMDAQRVAKQQGKIRFAGISNHAGHRELIPAVIKTGHFDVLLTSYNFTMGSAADDLLKAAGAAGLGIVGMKVMAGGKRRTGFYPTSDQTQAALRRDGAMLAALKWALRNPSVHTVIPSMVDYDQLRENMAAMAMPFTEVDEKVLSARLQEIRPLYCRMCGECSGTCPKGVPVPDVLRYLMYAEGYGQFALGRENFEQLPPEIRRVRCTACPECSFDCRGGVQVRKRLSRAQELFA